MDLLEFARGPALQVAAYILVAGVIWRLVGIIMLKEKPEFSEPRKAGGLMAALKVIYTRSFTADPFKRATLYPTMLAYVLHLGFFALRQGGLDVDCREKADLPAELLPEVDEPVCLRLLHVQYVDA